MRQRTWTLSAASVLASALLAIVWMLWPQGRPTLDQVREGVRPLRVGYAIEAPFAYLDDAGHVTGEAPEVLRRALTDLGITAVEWRYVEFAQLLHELEIGRIDAVAAGMFVTPERQARVLFTRPTVAVSRGLMVRAGNPLGLKHLEDVARRSGARLAVVAGSVEAAAALDVGMPAARIQGFPDARSAINALKADRVDAFSLSTPSLRRLLDEQQRPVLELVAEVRAPATGWPALAFRKDDETLRDAVDGWLARNLGGTSHLALAKQFGFEPADVQRAVGHAAEGRR